MSFTDVDTQWLSTREAGALLGRTPGSVKQAINFGTLRARREDVHGRIEWRIEQNDLLAWAATARRIHREAGRSREQAAELLLKYESLSAEELALLAGIHPGNARKHLAILAAEGRAKRLPDGQWVLTPDDIEQVSA